MNTDGSKTLWIWDYVIGRWINLNHVRCFYPGTSYPEDDGMNISIEFSNGDYSEGYISNKDYETVRKWMGGKNE